QPPPPGRRGRGAARLSFATAEETMALTGMMIGGVTIFALPSGVPIYVDDTLLECERVVLGGGSRSTKILIAPAVFSRLAGATVVPGLSGACALVAPRSTAGGGGGGGGWTGGGGSWTERSALVGFTARRRGGRIS